MANTKSAVKRVKSSTAKRMQRRMKKSELRTILRKFKEAVETNSPELPELLKYAVKKIDQAAAKNIIHKNAASRKKSQLHKTYNSVLVKE
ncbi:MAG: 30S ribosomal protein S20 [Clostridiaceae bacterium]|nr:30S ribosomal protein S20 [Clostridiaceae bacterium]